MHLNASDDVMYEFCWLMDNYASRLENRSFQNSRLTFGLIDHRQIRLLIFLGDDVLMVQEIVFKRAKDLCVSELKEQSQKWKSKDESCQVSKDLLLPFCALPLAWSFTILAILKQQLENDNKSWLVSYQKRGLELGQLQTAGNYFVIAQCLCGKTRAILCKVWLLWQLLEITKIVLSLKNNQDFSSGFI